MSDTPTTLPNLSEVLSPDLVQAIRSYHTFKQDKMPDDAKGFTAYHNACKSALMHIALLLKLIHTSSVDVPSADHTPDWLNTARQALKTQTEGIEDDDMFFD